MMRPLPCVWFELLVAQDDAWLVLQALAAAACVEVEWHPDSAAVAAAPQQLLAEFAALERRWKPYWPAPRATRDVTPGSPWQVLADGLASLRAWRDAAAPRIAALQAAEAELGELELARRALEALPASRLDFAALARARHGVASAVFALPVNADVSLPAGLLVRSGVVGGERLLLALGAPVAIETLAQSVLEAGGRRARFPDWLAPSVEASLKQLDERCAELRRTVAAQRATVDEASARQGLPAALADITRAAWCLEHGAAIVVGDVFARVTGWTTDRANVVRALAASEARALALFPDPPAGVRPPLVLRNPWWAQPFEVFTRLVGMPGVAATDPSTLLAFAVPLIFGYMFADVGQGLVLVALGWTLRHRFPLARLLVPGGVAASGFGFVFGSVFGREDLIAPLWLHPLAHPLPVLVVPIVGGALLLAVGLGLAGLTAWWQHSIDTWWREDAPLLLVYAGALGALVSQPLAWLMAAGVIVAVVAAWKAQRRAGAVVAALGELLERGAQLLLNTLSFARVGAFALAHAGLASAVVALAASAGRAGLVVLILGNVLIIVVEGLVVSIQTTRLVLFEFFTRFFRAEGREFRPLIAPTLPVAT